MTLTQNDLQSIREVVTDIVDFAVDKSETRMEAKMEAVEKRLTDKIADLSDEIHREISDIAGMNREFLAKLDNHEHRLTKLEHSPLLKSPTA